jgi:hypothetical protein
MWFKTSTSVKFMMKAAIYLCLIVIVYFYQILEVVNKFNEKLTNIAISDEKMEHGIKPPFMTLCSGPRAKQDVFDKYKMSRATLNEPNSTQKNELKRLNKTLENLFMEATFKLDEDFRLFIIWWDYGSEGWQRLQKQILLGNDNTQKVCKRKKSPNYCK